MRKVLFRDENIKLESNMKNIVTMILLLPWQWLGN